MPRLSDPREIVRCMLPTYPGERNTSYADLTSAKWVSDDVIRVVLKTRKDWLDSWFNAHTDVLLMCRHNNWHTACAACKNVVKNGIDKQLEQMAVDEILHPKPKYRLGKEPGRL